MKNSRAKELKEVECFQSPTLSFLGPDGEALSLYEMHNSPLLPANGIIEDAYAIRESHSVELVVPESFKIANLLNFMGYNLGAFGVRYQTISNLQ